MNKNQELIDKLLNDEFIYYDTKDIYVCYKSKCVISLGWSHHNIDMSCGYMLYQDSFNDLDYEKHIKQSINLSILSNKYNMIPGLDKIKVNFKGELAFENPPYDCISLIKKVYNDLDIIKESPDNIILKYNPVDIREDKFKSLYDDV